MTTYPLNIGCTVARHKQIGINAVVNARGGRRDLNVLTDEDVELRRDAHKIRDWHAHRVRIHQFNSRFARRHRNRLGHLISEED